MGVSVGPPMRRVMLTLEAYLQVVGAVGAYSVRASDALDDDVVVAAGRGDGVCAAVVPALQQPPLQVWPRRRSSRSAQDPTPTPCWSYRWYRRSTAEVAPSCRPSAEPPAGLHHRVADSDLARHGQPHGHHRPAALPQLHTHAAATKTQQPPPSTRLWRSETVGVRPTMRCRRPPEPAWAWYCVPPPAPYGGKGCAGWWRL